MIIRDYQESDREQILELFKKQGFDYPFPDLSYMIEHLVIEVDGKIILSVAAKPTVELYMWADSEWGTPGFRRHAIFKIYEPMRRRLFDRNIQDAHSFLPPQVSKALGRRVRKYFGWIKSTWDCYVGFTGR